MRLAQGLTTLTAMAALSGCAVMPGYDSEFACPKTDYGSPCMSARQAYMESNPGGGLVTESDKTTHSHKHPSTTKRAAPRSTPVPSLVMPGLDSPRPIRTPAQIMRIYIAPWVSQDGALTMPFYVYTQIEPRRWTLGVRAPRSTDPQSFYPLQIQKRSPGNGRDASGASGDGPAASVQLPQ